MKFNVDKCKIMHVGKNNPQYEYFMSGKKLMVVEEEKDIGVTIHSSLKPSKHCKRVADTANAVLRQLTKNFHFRNWHICKKLYVQRYNTSDHTTSSPHRHGHRGAIQTS